MKVFKAVYFNGECYPEDQIQYGRLFSNYIRAFNWCAEDIKTNPGFYEDSTWSIIEVELDTNRERILSVYDYYLGKWDYTYLLNLKDDLSSTCPIRDGIITEEMYENARPKVQSSIYDERDKYNAHLQEVLDYMYFCMSDKRSILDGVIPY